MSVLLEVLFALGLLVCVGLVWGFLQRNISERSSLAGKYAYDLKRSLLTESELQFYKVLGATVGDTYTIVPQVSVSAFLKPRTDGQNEYAARQHIHRRSVDFLLCTPGTLTPILAIELDGKSHERDDRRERDEEMERIFRDARLGYLRVPRAESYDSTSLKEQIHKAMG